MEREIQKGQIRKEMKIGRWCRETGGQESGDMKRARKWIMGKTKHREMGKKERVRAKLWSIAKYLMDSERGKRSVCSGTTMDVQSGEDKRSAGNKRQ